MPKIIVFDGIIGCGKSTLLKSFERLLRDKGIKARAIIEPVDQWRESGALLRFYNDTKNFCFEFQIYAAITRMENILKTMENDTDTDIFLLESSPYTDRYVFADMLSGDMGSARMRMYDDLWDILKERMAKYEIDVFIYLDAKVSTAMERIKKRGRMEEILKVSKQYLYALRHNYLKFYSETLPKIDEDSNPVVLGSGFMEIDFTDDGYISNTLTKILEITHTLIDLTPCYPKGVPLPNKIDTEEEGGEVVSN